MAAGRFGILTFAMAAIGSSQAYKSQTLTTNQCFTGGVGNSPKINALFITLLLFMVKRAGNPPNPPSVGPQE